jgi:streptomycin 6-kinase
VNRRTLPRSLVESAAADPTPDRRDWISTLPHVVDDLAQRWSLRVDEPFQPGGQCSWVAPVQDGAGRDLVLKVGWRHQEAEHEAAALRLWDGAGAVVLHASCVQDQTSALLLERCVPGTALKQLVAEPEQDVVVAGLLRRLWVQPARPHPFRSLQVMCDAWADELEAKLAARPEALDPGMARAGGELLRSLPSSADREVLLLTDLHGDNILAAQREPWLVVDPKPHVGDPTYDALQHLLNCPGRLTEDPLALVRRMADLLDLDPRRLALWSFARCVQEGVDQPLLAGVARVLGSQSS